MDINPGVPDVLEEDVDERWAQKRKAKKAARRKRTTPDMPLIITSLMDAFTIILCFLLKTYGSDPVNITQSNDLRLPGSVAKAPLRAATTIAITRNAILVDDRRVVDLRDGAVDPSNKRDGATGYFINPLFDALTEAAQNQKLIASRNQAIRFEGLALVLGHKTTTFRTLTEVLYTAGQAEFNQFKFAVVQSTGSNN
jgi:hypothetical protein